MRGYSFKTQDTFSFNISNFVLFVIILTNGVSGIFIYLITCTCTCNHIKIHCFINSGVFFFFKGGHFCVDKMTYLRKSIHTNTLSL